MLQPALALKISLRKRLSLLFQYLFLKLIGLYQLLISPLIGNACRFHPSCSEYAREAVGRYGFAKGGYLSVRRLIKCHPFNPGGYDPVPGVNNVDSEKN